MKNFFEFNGKKYRLRNFDLDLLHRASPLLIKYRELHHKYTCNIDTTALDEAENELNIINEAIDEMDENKTTDITAKNKLQERYNQAEAKLRTPQFKTLRQYVSDMEALALYEIITDSVFVAELFNRMLLPAEADETVNFTAEELKAGDALEFIRKVISSFFLILPALNGK